MAVLISRFVNVPHCKCLSCPIPLTRQIQQGSHQHQLPSAWLRGCTNNKEHTPTSNNSFFFFVRLSPICWKSRPSQPSPLLTFILLANCVALCHCLFPHPLFPSVTPPPTPPHSLLTVSIFHLSSVTCSSSVSASVSNKQLFFQPSPVTGSLPLTHIFSSSISSVFNSKMLPFHSTQLITWMWMNTSRRCPPSGRLAHCTICIC